MKEMLESSFFILTLYFLLSPNTFALVRRLGVP